MELNHNELYFCNNCGFEYPNGISVNECPKCLSKEKHFLNIDDNEYNKSIDEINKIGIKEFIKLNKIGYNGW